MSQRPDVIEGQYRSKPDEAPHYSPQARVDRLGRRIVYGVVALGFLIGDAWLVTSRMAKQPESGFFYPGIGLVAAAIICAALYATSRGEAE